PFLRQRRQRDEGLRQRRIVERVSAIDEDFQDEVLRREHHAVAACSTTAPSSMTTVSPFGYCPSSSRSATRSAMTCPPYCSATSASARRLSLSHREASRTSSNFNLPLRAKPIDAATRSRSAWLACENGTPLNMTVEPSTESPSTGNVAAAIRASRSVSMAVSLLVRICAASR